MTSHQIKTFTGRGGGKVEDRVQDMRYVIDSKGPMPLCAEFNEIVRLTGGRAPQFGERAWTASPMAAFYARMQHPNEAPSDYAIAL